MSPPHVSQQTSDIHVAPGRRSDAPRFLVAPLAFAAFVSLGLPDGVLGVAWPSIRHAFGLPVSRLGVILTAGVCGALLSSFLSGQIVRAIGVGKLLLISSVIVVAGLMGT